MEIFDIESPEGTSLDARRRLQHEQEAVSFDEDAYMYSCLAFIAFRFDFIDEEQNVSQALAFPPPLNETEVEFSDFERNQLITLGHKSCIYFD